MVSLTALHPHFWALSSFGGAGVVVSAALCLEHLHCWPGYLWWGHLEGRQPGNLSRLMGEGGGGANVEAHRLHRGEFEGIPGDSTVVDHHACPKSVLFAVNRSNVVKLPKLDRVGVRKGNEVWQCHVNLEKLLRS